MKLNTRQELGHESKGLLSLQKDKEVKLCLCELARSEKQPFMSDSELKSITRLLKAIRLFTILESQEIMSICNRKRILNQKSLSRR